MFVNISELSFNEHDLKNVSIPDTSKDPVITSTPENHQFVHIKDMLSSFCGSSIVFIL